MPPLATNEDDQGEVEYLSESFPAKEPYFWDTRYQDTLKKYLELTVEASVFKLEPPSNPVI